MKGKHAKENFSAVGAMAPTPLSLKTQRGGVSHTRAWPGRPPGGGVGVWYRWVTRDGHGTWHLAGSAPSPPDGHGGGGDRPAAPSPLATPHIPVADLLREAQIHSLLPLRPVHRQNTPGIPAVVFLRTRRSGVVMGLGWG